MAQQNIGILHPGAMGARVGEQAARSGAAVWWLAAGRSEQSRARAEAGGLRDAGSLAQMASSCSIILSVCPPASALEVARSVAAASFSGIYVDANAISPSHAADVAALFGSRARVVDGGIVGGPPVRAGDARLYLSGPESAAVDEVQALFAGTALTPIVLPGPIGQASALKLAFASFNKISYLLAAQSFALASGHGVLDELLSLAEEVVPGTLLARPSQVATAGPRAWRWAPEMAEIADAFAAVDTPGSVAEAACAGFARWASLKSAADDVTLADLIRGLSS